MRFTVAYMALFWLTGQVNAADLPVQSLTAPRGFSISLLARVPGARSLALGDQGTLFVGTRQTEVFAVAVDQSVRTIARGLEMPNGVAFVDGALYVATHRELLRWPAIEQHLDAPGRPQRINIHFPPETHHGWRYLGVAPDGALHVAIGAPCNVCALSDPYGTILRVPEGGAPEVVARGVRNSVGFDWHPGTHAMWFTNNGRDGLGDRRPPDTLNRVDVSGAHFGFPMCLGDGLPDPEWGADADCSQFTAPVQRLGAHVAALGMRFYTGAQFPQAYHHQVFIAEHGSWNSSAKVGYRVSLVTLDAAGRALSYSPFIEGWLHNGMAWGRPVDLQVTPDGGLYISDDRAGAIYHVTYTEP